MSTNIIDKLKEESDKITENDLAWAIPDLLRYFDSKIGTLSRFAYALGHSDSNTIAKRAFIELSQETLEKGFRTYFFKSQHWRNGHNVQAYFTTCLNRLAQNTRKDAMALKKVSVPICPGCKTYNQREYLTYESDGYRCYACTKAAHDLSKEKNAEYRIRSIFAHHSRKGYCCPDCNRFLPDSAMAKSPSCIYDDCSWFGSMAELNVMSHPLGVSSRQHLSLNNSVGEDSGGSSFQDMVEVQEVSADLKIEITQNYNIELKELHNVIDTQAARLQYSSKSLKKRFMYQAYKNLLEKYPNDMVSYLVHQTHGDVPIQARIFQEFIRLLENELPFMFSYYGKDVEIFSLQDPRLDLFNGYSEFESYVRPDGSIPNLTKEIYVGGRKLKDFGPCFIGQLIDVKDESGNSILEKLDYYTFSQIKMKDLPPGMKVFVSHFRMPSHYEMLGLVQLQRCRKKIVDSVYQRLHKQPRIPRKTKN